MTNLRSVCLQWISRLFEKGERATERTNQTSRGFGAASQMTGNNYLGLNAGPFWQKGASNQFNLNSPGLNAVNSSLVEINKGRSGVSYDLNRFSSLSHRSVFLLVDANGEAYDFDGNKWSRVR